MRVEAQLIFQTTNSPVSQSFPTERSLFMELFLRAGAAVRPFLRPASSRSAPGSLYSELTSPSLFCRKRARLYFDERLQAEDVFPIFPSPRADKRRENVW